MPFVAALLVLLVSGAAETQSSARRQIVGRVVDSAGEPLPGVFVTVRPIQQNGWLPELEAVSDAVGRFRFDDVPPGTYRVAGHLPGFKLRYSTVEVAADRNSEVSVVMEVGQIAECPDTSYPARIRTRNAEHLPTAYLTVIRPGQRLLSYAVDATGSPEPCFVPLTQDEVTLDVLGYGEHTLKRAGLEPGKVSWQITIEASSASRIGRTSRAQATGHIRGRVFDEYGASIPNASVSFEPLDPSSGLTPFAAVADSRGRFDFIGVRPGTYRVTGKLTGFDTTVMIQEVVAGVETDVTVVVRRREGRS